MSISWELLKSILDEQKTCHCDDIMTLED